MREHSKTWGIEARLYERAETCSEAGLLIVREQKREATSSRLFPYERAQ